MLKCIPHVNKIISGIRLVREKIEDQAMINQSGKFDLVYCTYSLHHWKDPVRAIKGMYRIFSDRGILMLHDLKRQETHEPTG